MRQFQAGSNTFLRAPSGPDWSRVCGAPRRVPSVVPRVPLNRRPKGGPEGPCDPRTGRPGGDHFLAILPQIGRFGELCPGRPFMSVRHAEGRVRAMRLVRRITLIVNMKAVINAEKFAARLTA